MKKFGERLRNERERCHLSAGVLAQACGVSRSYITLIENGHRLPGTKIIPKMAEALGLETHAVLNWYLDEMRTKAEQSWQTDTTD